jgi:hypothetical protein
MRDKNEKPGENLYNYPESGLSPLNQNPYHAANNNFKKVADIVI